ncbi:hypothetical protein O6H91_16G016800 [Diphasiastrum complanatum]|uniref:Uncharacterized protein n=1 Tax=Diphasiastrum complanatum TaxID=34168 RepID=A0ACC2BA39_DIPCM|nr:hypothetical protein O6H91_16G016800 [Diphasiastrum complanatum]
MLGRNFFVVDFGLVFHVLPCFKPAAELFFGCLVLLLWDFDSLIKPLVKGLDYPSEGLLYDFVFRRCYGEGACSARLFGYFDPSCGFVSIASFSECQACGCKPVIIDAI